MCRGFVKFAFLALGMLLSTGLAQANSIQIFRAADNLLLGELKWDTDFGADPGLIMLGYTAPTTTSSTQAIAFNLANSGVATEAGQLNTLVGSVVNPANGSGVTQFNTSGDPIDFTISSQYFSLKIDGPNGGTAFFKNLYGTLHLTYDTVQYDLSHYSTYVPAPMVGAGIPGLILACGAMVALARRRRKIA